jgi:uncharacterized surface protein with fasciclin (FAS1) repeats
MKTIVQTAIDNGSFGTLVKALQEADLVDTLNGAGPFTVFAPNDAAFAKIPKDTLSAVLADKKKLTSILTYHVLSGKVMAADAMNVSQAKTLQGEVVKITHDDSGVMINDAKVVSADIECTNGVIHVIDTVLMPS